MLSQKNKKLKPLDFIGFFGSCTPLPVTCGGCCVGQALKSKKASPLSGAGVRLLKGLCCFSKNLLNRAIAGFVRFLKRSGHKFKRFVKAIFCGWRLGRRGPFWGRKQAKKFCNPILRDCKIFRNIPLVYHQKTLNSSHSPGFSRFLHIKMSARRVFLSLLENLHRLCIFTARRPADHLRWPSHFVLLCCCEGSLPAGKPKGRFAIHVFALSKSSPLRCKKPRGYAVFCPNIFLVFLGWWG